MVYNYMCRKLNSSLNILLDAKSCSTTISPVVACYDMPNMLMVPLAKVRFNETQKFMLTDLTGRKIVSTYESR
jgi:hypothetical protein